MNLKNKKIMVIDSGSFFETALSLTKYFEEVLYYVQWTSGFPGMDKYVIGTEWINSKQIESFDKKPLRRIDSIWNNLKEVDIIFICDVYDGDIADHIKELGYPVVHAGYKGSELELDRWAFKQLQKSHGMDLNKAERVIGIDALRKKLLIVTDKFIKISRFRKQTETFHHDQYKLTEPILNKLEHEMGPMSKIVEFIIEDPIDAIVEEGCDTYSIMGKYPKKLLCGVEIKDCGYAGAIVDYENLSKGVKKTNDQLSSIFKEVNYHGFFSTEVRTTKNNENYLIDMTNRLPQPPSALYGEIFDNLGDIIWALGQGEVIDVNPKAKYGLYACIYSDWYDESHQCIYFPERYRNNIKLNYPIKIDGDYYCLNINNFPECGAVVTIGESFEDCKKQMEEIAAEIKGYGISVKVDSMDKAIEGYSKMMKTSKV